MEKSRILVVDDDPRNLRLMSAILESHGYEYETALSGGDAIEKTKEFKPDLVYLDIMMPGMDGYETCRRLKEHPSTGHVPVIMVTALEDRDSRIRGLESGAHDFLTKPIDSTELMVRTKNLLRVKEFEDFLRRHSELLESEVKERTLELTNTLVRLSESNELLSSMQVKLKEGYVDTIHRLTMVSEYKDEETGLHIKRIGRYCAHVAKELGWDDGSVETIFFASPMHDIGKVGIPADILLKPAILNPEEFALMKTHAAIGARILAGSPSTMLQMAERIALCHHERWDGGGYPRGLSGEDIPLEARIMNIADQYDALRSRRPYKPPIDHEKAYSIIAEGDGRTLPAHFDPQIMKVFNDTHETFHEIFETHKG